MKNPVLVMGAGHQGLAMAAHLSLQGECVYLWNRTQEHLAPLLEAGGIRSLGAVKGMAVIPKISSQIGEAMAKTVLVTTPASAHRDIAKVLAPHITEDMMVILNPGRTLGAIEFARALKEAGCTKLPLLAETQTIIYTCRRSASNEVMVYALKRGVPIAALGGAEKTREVLGRLPLCLREYYAPAKSLAQTSLGNVGMVLHCAPVLMNVGWIESEKAQFKYYYDGISPTVAAFLEKLDAERLAVAKALNTRVESVQEWMCRTYQTHGANLYECLRNNQSYREIDAPATMDHRYIKEDVPCGLVPLERLGQACGVHTPLTTLIVDWANALLNQDFRQLGRYVTLREIEDLLQ